MARTWVNRPAGLLTLTEVATWLSYEARQRNAVDNLLRRRGIYPIACSTLDRRVRYYDWAELQSLAHRCQN